MLVYEEYPGKGTQKLTETVHAARPQMEDMEEPRKVEQQVKAAVVGTDQMTSVEKMLGPLPPAVGGEVCRQQSVEKLAASSRLPSFLYPNRMPKTLEKKTLETHVYSGKHEKSRLLPPAVVRVRLAARSRPPSFVYRHRWWQSLGNRHPPKPRGTSCPRIPASVGAEVLVDRRRALEIAIKCGI